MGRRLCVVTLTLVACLFASTGELKKNIERFYLRFNSVSWRPQARLATSMTIFLSQRRFTIPLIQSTQQYRYKQYCSFESMKAKAL